MALATRAEAPASRRPSRACRAALVLGAVAALAGSAHAAPPSAVITQRDTGKRFTLRVDSESTLRLSGRWVWTEPRVAGSAIRLMRVDYFVDPGYSEWEIHVVWRGVATISSRGIPSCVPCTLAPRRFRVTIHGALSRFTVPGSPRPRRVSF